MLTCSGCGTPAESDHARFCTECGEALGSSQAQAGDRTDVPKSRSAVPASHVERGLSGGDTPSEAHSLTAQPVMLEINDNHFYMEEYACALEFRLSSLRGTVNGTVELSVAGPYLGHIKDRRLTLSSDGIARTLVQFVPDLAGELVVDITLCLVVGSEKQVWTAQPLLKVLAKNEDPTSVVFDFSQHAGGNIGYGLSNRNELREGFAKGLINSANDLLKQVYPEAWRRVPLTPGDVLPEQRLSVIAELADRGPRMTKASLVFHSDTAGECRVLLLGVPTVRMGRQRQQNDIVLRRFPRSEENDQKTRQINRTHLAIALRRDGLYLIDFGTANGTRAGGRTVRGELKLPLAGPSDVDVAGALQLRVTPFHDVCGHKAINAGGCQRLGPSDELWETAEHLGVRSVLVERVDNLSREESYVVVFRWATCGSGPDSEVRLPYGGLERSHLRILRLGGHLWVESLVEQDRLAVNGIPVGSGSAFPMLRGLLCRCGELEGAIEDFKQCGLVQLAGDDETGPGTPGW